MKTFSKREQHLKIKSSDVHPSQHARMVLLFFIFKLILAGCAEGSSASPSVINLPMETATTKPSLSTPTTIMPTEVTITGWFTTIWNGDPHYSITDDQGQTTKLLIEEKITKPMGGPLALDRKRVTVIGEIVDTPPGALQVISIRIEKEQ